MKELTVADIEAWASGASHTELAQVKAHVEHYMAQLCSQCGPGHDQGDGRCSRHGKWVGSQPRKRRR